MTQKALLDSYRHGVLEQQRRELEQRMEMAVKESEDKVVHSNDGDVIPMYIFTSYLHYVM